MASESKEAVAALETKFGEAGDAQFLMNGGFSLGTHVNIIELSGDMVDILYIYIYVCVYIYIYVVGPLGPLGISHLLTLDRHHR